jgi:hypothetical protein
MSNLIEPSDPRYFKQTSDKPYDRHHYKIVFTNGESEVFESWQEVFSRWWQVPSQFSSHIEVLDIKKTKTKGFA